MASKCASQSSGGFFGGGSSPKKSQKANFALKAAGAYVEDVSYEGNNVLDIFKGGVFRYTGINFEHDNPSYLVLDSNNEPGECWCFKGQQANITIHLIAPMKPSEFFLYHIYMDYYDEAKIDMSTAAPKDFSVVGVDAHGEYLLGDCRVRAHVRLW